MKMLHRLNVASSMIYYLQTYRRVKTQIIDWRGISIGYNLGMNRIKNGG